MHSCSPLTTCFPLMMLKECPFKHQRTSKHLENFVDIFLVLVTLMKMLLCTEWQLHFCPGHFKTTACVNWWFCYWESMDCLKKLFQNCHLCYLVVLYTILTILDGFLTIQEILYFEPYYWLIISWLMKEYLSSWSLWTKKVENHQTLSKLGFNDHTSNKCHLNSSTIIPHLCRRHLFQSCHLTCDLMLGDS